MKTMTPQELQKQLSAKTCYVLDVRSEEKYQAEHIVHGNIISENIPKANILNLSQDDSESIRTLPTDKNIIITCTTGNSARNCATVLEEKGYDVTVLEGGITSWKQHQQED
ncbi:MAG TPA: rhodanese-like domain-containing protein [Virgibacillus sp.]|nr:rhodanese-like domain-containing protein [Virgibacillus sp.]